ncbi:MAG: arginine--tRNA ligase [Chloroflexi bacterium]|jgi:arginyl-tRNA synthetase|nr:arginine--tRNA ligase [Chloroflexota bacterium]
MMIENELQKAISQAIQAAQQQGELPAFDLPAEIPVEHPKQEEMGDFATPVSLQLARPAHMAPLKIAEIVASHLPTLPFVGSVEVARPGFINFRLSESWLTSQVEEILGAADSFGNVGIGHEQRVQVEYVSANPTGPLHVGSARNAVIGDVLASVLEAAGYDVQREYYVNDAGSRIRALYETLYARYAQALGIDEPVPEDGYQGPYMIELGTELARDYDRRFLDMFREDALQEIGAIGLRRIISQAQEDLAVLGLHYDHWFSEQSLYENSQYEKAMDILRRGGYIYEKEGAVWFRATDFGVSKDEVLVRSNGTPGYFASDIAYHYNKFIERGFDKVIDVWGADHQGHVPRMRAMMQALGLDPDRLTIILYQLVTLKRGGEVVRLSKRTGDIITLREVVDEVGADAVRYFLLSRSADSQMDFDLELAKQQSDENPVYYIQYAHARISSILRFAQNIDYQSGDVSLLTSEPELGLIRRMLRLPETVVTAAINLAPHHLAYYAYDLASAFHGFYRDCRVVSSEPGEEAITKARLKLVAACQIVLARALGLMGMTAPTVM